MRSRYGAPPIRIVARQRDRHLRVAVEDGGLGVPKELEGRIFDRFARGGGETGHGLGLAIARAYAQAHGGDLVYDPRPGGARFELLIPQETERAEQARLRFASLPSGARWRRRPGDAVLAEIPSRDLEPLDRDLRGLPVDRRRASRQKPSGASACWRSFTWEPVSPNWSGSASASASSAVVFVCVVVGTVRPWCGFGGSVTGGVGGLAAVEDADGRENREEDGEDRQMAMIATCVVVSVLPATSNVALARRSPSLVLREDPDFLGGLLVDAAVDPLCVSVGGSGSSNQSS